jgi:Flp pilus assembly protein TadG
MKASILSSERGQALIMIAFAAIALFAFAALAIDGSIIFSDRRHAQNAADTSALAAALAKTRQQAYAPVAFARAASNGYDNNGTTSVVEVYLCTDPRATCVALPTGADPAEYIQVKITSEVKTYFARVIGWKTVTNHVNAVAHAAPSEYKEMFAGSAVIGLDPVSCHAVTYQGNASTVVVGGGILVMSRCTNGAFFNNSNSAQLSAPSLCSVGDIVYNPNAINIPSMQEGCSPPPAIVEPNPECSGNAVKTGSHLSPGRWTGHFPPNEVDTLESGIYCVNGDFRINGGDSLTGIGVVIRMDSGDVSWNGGADIHLEAPTEGPFDGLLMYVPGDASCPSSTVTINGNSGSVIVGSILAPCSQLNIDGTGDAGINGKVVGYRVTLSGNTGIKIFYDADLNTDELTQPNIQMNQ